MNGMHVLSITVPYWFSEQIFIKSIVPSSSAQTATVHVHASVARRRFPSLPPLWAFSKWVIILSFSVCLWVSSSSPMNYRWRSWNYLLKNCNWLLEVVSVFVFEKSMSDAGCLSFWFFEMLLIVCGKNSLWSATMMQSRSVNSYFVSIDSICACVYLGPFFFLPDIN